MSQVSPQTMANAIRALAMDAVQKAKSGHPGMPMGMADIATALWTRHLRFNPQDPKWSGRDRFILSNGHGSMLQYALLHLTGFDLSMDDLKAFRQLGSRTPGHPEVDITPGVETTTGPLGQGIANGVGMALAEKLLAAEFNRDGFPVVDNRTYVFLGDGCLMEGISHEVCSLAGVWKLNKLIALYDDNGISIDGDVRGWFRDDTRGRFEAYGWNVIGPVDGHDINAVDQAIAQAKESAEKPTLIICRTTIGKGSPNRQGTAKVHGEALGDEEIAATKAALGWTYGPFEIPQDVYAAWDHRAEGAKIEKEWQQMYAGYKAAYPELAKELERRLAGDLPDQWDAAVMDAVCQAAEAAETVATRKASQKALNALAPVLPELLGGSADLTGSNLTNWSGSTSLNTGDFHARHISYGVREFGMSAGTGFKVPNLGFVNERYAKTFTAPLRFNDAAEFCSAFACGAAAAEQYVGDVVLGNARFLDVRINGKCGFRGEDRFRAGESHAGFVEAAGTVKLRLPVGNRRVAEGILRKRVGEVIHAAVRFAAVKTGLTLAGRMNDEVLGFKRGAVGAAGDDE